MDREEISHIGRVVEVTPELTTVEIISSSACAECHASGLCGISEYTTKAVQVPTSPYKDYEVGEEVDVVLKASMGHKAVWIAYMIPLVILLGALLGSLACGVSEILSALVAFVAVGLYYWIIYLFRNRMRNEYVFTIRSKK